MKEGFEVEYRTPIEHGLQSLDVKDQVAQYVQQRGLFAPQQPMIHTGVGQQPFNGQLPPHLTELTDDQLGDLLNQLGRWQDFIQTELAYAYNAFKQTEAQVEFVEAQLYISYKNDENGKKRNDTERKSLMTIDRRLIDVKRNLVYYESVYRIIKAMAAGADKNWDTVSRRISQRQQDLERGRREGHVQSFQTQQPMFRR